MGQGAARTEPSLRPRHIGAAVLGHVPSPPPAHERPPAAVVSSLCHLVHTRSAASPPTRLWSDPQQPARLAPQPDGDNQSNSRIPRVAAGGRPLTRAKCAQIHIGDTAEPDYVPDRVGVWSSHQQFLVRSDFCGRRPPEERQCDQRDYRRAGSWRVPEGPDG